MIDLLMDTGGSGRTFSGSGAVGTNFCRAACTDAMTSGKAVIGTLLFATYAEIIVAVSSNESSAARVALMSFICFPLKHIIVGCRVGIVPL